MRCLLAVGARLCLMGLILRLVILQEAVGQRKDARPVQTSPWLALSLHVCHPRQVG